MTATLGCVWLLMLLTSIEAFGLRQDQRHHSFKGTDAGHSVPPSMPCTATARGSAHSSPDRPRVKLSDRLRERRARVFGAGGCGRIGIGAPHREAIAEDARASGVTLTRVVRSA